MATVHGCEVETRPDGMRVFTAGAFREGYVRVAKGVVLLLPRGNENSGVRRTVMRTIDEENPFDQTLQLFTDLRQVPRLSAESTEDWIAWSRRRRPELLHTHNLVSSKLLEMALSVANMLVKVHLHSYSNEADFVAALSKHSPGFAKLPVV